MSKDKTTAPCFQEESIQHHQQLSLRQTTTLAGALQVVQALIAGYGEEAQVDLSLRQHRVVKVDRKQIYEAFLARDQLVYLCVDLACPHVGTLIYAPATTGNNEETPSHQGRRCVLYPLTPPVGLEIAPDELEQYAQAVLEALNFGAGDSPYVPEATWEFRDDDEER